MNMKSITCLFAVCMLTFGTVQAQTDAEGYIRLNVDTSSPEYVSPFIFGHNLEHTRACVNNGLSAQMLQNRKFAGKPSRNHGVPAHWFGIGEKTFFYQSSPYTKHICLEKMWRMNELQSQVVANMTEGLTAGIGQQGLDIEAGKTYELRMVTKVSEALTLKIELCDRDGVKTYASKEISLTPSEDWVKTEFELIPSASDGNASIRYSFTRRAEVCFGVLSMMPADNFHGMRKDVVAYLKEIGPAILRWPGGNFAGEYRWKDGLLDADLRGPLQAATEIETQPYTDGYDFHEINTDDFIALCREVGAEPFITINLMWSTPEESAQWVEYCNGATDTEYGRKRAERGHIEPYDVKFWSLGNEMGYVHMEGTKLSSGYAEIASGHAEAMLRTSHGLQIFSSGPFPNDDWAANSAAVLADKAPYVSLHTYCGGTRQFTTEEGIRKSYNEIIQVDGPMQHARNMRECLDRTGVKMHISYDEWNQWYSWYRPSCVSEGIFTAKFLHGIINLSTPLDIPVCCYFQPVGEGAIIITPTSSRLTANGQVFAIMKAHKGGKLCPVSGAAEYCAIATVKDNVLTVTIINDSYDEQKEFELAVKGKVQNAKLLSSDDVKPYSYFTESEPEVICGRKSQKITLPPHSVASIEMDLQK